MGRWLALLAALIGATVIAWMLLQPPKSLPASAPATAFSAERAMIDDRLIAAEPHPIGSAANHAVRDLLLRRMSELGLSPQVRPGVAAYSSAHMGGGLLGGRVENLVGVLPGRDRSAPALALMAHYDSVPASSGAADDGAGVVSALEIVRALKARGAPERDVMVVLTDGEEAGLLGADAFFGRDPLAKRIGFLVNMEARGDAGRVQMFQTGLDNGETIALLRKAAVRPSASSLTGFIYEHMPNDTDFTISRKAGIAGLNYAFAGRQFDYHSPTSTPDTLDPGSLQDMGQQVLAVAQAAAFSPTLPQRAPSLVYGQVAGDLIVAYPPWVGWIVLAVAAVLTALGVARARRREAFPWSDVLRGLGACVFAVIGAATVMHLARRMTGAAFGYFEQRFLLAQVTRWEIALLLIGLGFLLAAIAELARGRRQIAFVPLAAGLAASLFGGFDAQALGMGVVAALIGLAAYGRPVSRAGAWSGVLILGLLLTAALQATAPLAAFILAWPLLVAALAAAATDVAARKGPVALALLAILGALTLGWIGALAHTAYTSLDLVELLALPALLTAFVIWPLAQPAEGAPPERLLGPALLLIGLAVTVAVRFNDPYSARYPKLAYVQYFVDADAGRAWRVRLKGEPSAWSDAVLRADGGQIAPFRHWAYRGAVEAAPARSVRQPPPAASLAKQPDGALHLHVDGPPGAQMLALTLQPNTPATLVAADGVPVTLALPPGQPTRIVWRTSGDGVDLTLRPAGPGTLELRTAADVPAWPADAAPLPKRPPNLMPFDLSDTTLVAKRAAFSW